MHGLDLYRFYKKCARTRYTELMFLRPLGSVGHIVYSGCVPGAKCLRTIFQTRVHQYGCDKKRVRTSYTELEFLHPVASAGQVVHSGVSGV
jgi:hypothetical protein